MKKMISKVFKFAIISAVIYFGIAAVLILTGKPKKPDPAQRGLAFDELFFDYSSLPELKTLFSCGSSPALAIRINLNEIR